MRAVLQRVSSAQVVVGGEIVGEIGRGFDFPRSRAGRYRSRRGWLAGRVTKLRIFESEPGRMDESLIDVDGEALVISQFTLFGSLKKGNRPSFNRAAPSSLAVPRYQDFVHKLSVLLGKNVPTGRFGEDMKIEAQNDGPVTLIVDTKERDFRSASRRKARKAPNRRAQDGRASSAGERSWQAARRKWKWSGRRLQILARC